MTSPLRVQHASTNEFKRFDRLPDDAAVVALLVGDSNSACDTSVSGLGLVNPLPNAFLYSKWLQASGFRTTFADEGANEFIPMPPNEGIANGDLTGGYPLAKGLHRRLSQTTGVRDVYVVQTLGPFSTIGAVSYSDAVNGLACWDEFTEGASATANTLRSLHTEHYARPAIQDLLDAGRPVYFAGLYTLGWSTDCCDPADTFASAALVEDGLAGAWRGRMNGLRSIIASRLGLENLPTYMGRPLNVGPVRVGTDRINFGKNWGTIVDQARELHNSDPWFSLVEPMEGTLDTDLLHYSAPSAFQNVQRLGASLGKQLPMVQITELPT